MLRVLGRANSINVQKVMWCAAELGLEVERVDVGGAFGGNDQPDYLAKNPTGLVPTLEDGDLVLWESHTIVRYLCEAHGSAPWQPADLATRYQAQQWMDFYISQIHAQMTVIFWGLIRTPEDKRDMAAIDAAVERAAKWWTLVDKHLAERDYVTGDAPTFGDVPLGCAAYRWHEMQIERPKLDNLKAYYDRLAGRPAYREHVMLPLT
jgi:glutathione S-transferase